MQKKKRKFKLKKKLIICTIIAVLSFFGVTYGRFIYNGIRNYYLSTKNFYFNSDKLGESLTRYQVDNWSGVEPVTIKINMNSRKNNKISSKENINYTIKYRCSNNVTCESTSDESVILATSNTDSFSIIMTPITFLEDGDSAWLEVDTIAFEPYDKTLSGRFVINVGTIGLSHEIIDSVGSPYLDFAITNTIDYYKVLTAFDGYDVNDHIDIATYLALDDNKKKNCASAVVTLRFDPEILRLDMTNEAYLNSVSYTETEIGGFNYIDSITFYVEAISSSMVRFYKLDTSNDYTYPYVNDVSIVDFITG
jgi:hypothetical protein